MATEKELRQSLSEVRKLAEDEPKYRPLLKQLEAALASLETPGRVTTPALRVTEQPVPSGQIPSPREPEGSAGFGQKVKR